MKNMTNMKYTPHARERCKERDITKKPINISDIKKMPIYTTDNGCTKYLDVKNLLVYYVRGNRIVTATKCVNRDGTPNPIQMLRYYCISQKINFRDICRDNIFNNCKRGANCKFRHLEINTQ